MQKNIVAEYDYYTLDQARKIILAEENQRKKETIECYIGCAVMCLMPILMFLHWLIVGY